MKWYDVWNLLQNYMKRRNSVGCSWNKIDYDLKILETEWLGKRIHINVPLYKVFLFWESWVSDSSTELFPLLHYIDHGKIKNNSRILCISFLIQKRFPKQEVKTVVKNVSPWSSWTLFSHLTLPRNSYVVFGKIRFSVLIWLPSKRGQMSRSTVWLVSSPSSLGRLCHCIKMMHKGSLF